MAGFACVPNIEKKENEAIATLESGRYKNRLRASGVTCPRCGRWIPFDWHSAELQRHVVSVSGNRVVLVCPEPSKRRKISFTTVGMAL